MTVQPCVPGTPNAPKIQPRTLASATFLLLTLVVGTLTAGGASAEPPGQPHASPRPAPNMVAIGWMAPSGAAVELATTQGWVQLNVPFRVALAVGHTYLLRIHTETAGEPIVLCPTVHVLRPVHVPKELNPWDYAVPIALTPSDIAEIRRGGFITKVITLERPETAVPVNYPADEMPELDVQTGVDPLLYAETVGMPVLIVRVGNRVYRRAEALGRFAAPVHLPPPSAEPSAEADATIQQASFDVIERFSSATMFPRPHPFVSSPAAVLDPSMYWPARIDYSYVCDGGDRVPRAGRDPAGVTHGLAPSEAVGFYTVDGRLVSVPAAPVCVYAPRYAAVRGVRWGAVQRSRRNPRALTRLQRRVELETHRTAQVQRRREDIAIERSERRPLLSRQRVAVSVASRVDVLHADHQAQGLARIVLDMASGTLTQGREAWLASRVQAARVWQIDQLPAYTALSRQSGVLQGYARPEAAVKIQEPPRRGGSIILWKVANREAAQPGEIIEFAIYYKNVGDEPVRALSIMDSLVPRLEYVEKSSGSTRASVFTVGPNKAGSTVLRWDLPGEIKPGEQGAVWFKARVR